MKPSLESSRCRRAMRSLSVSLYASLSFARGASMSQDVASSNFVSTSVLENQQELFWCNMSATWLVSGEKSSNIKAMVGYDGRVQKIYLGIKDDPACRILSRSEP